MRHIFIIDAHGKARRKPRAERRAEAVRIAKAIMAGKRPGKIYYY